MINNLILALLTIVGAISSIWFLYDKWQKRRRLSWKRLEKSVLAMVERMRQENFTPTLICGIGRGGAILGALISGAFGHRPLVVFDIDFEWQDGRRGETLFGSVPLQSDLDSVLLVVGAVHSGNTIRLCYEHFKSVGARDIRRATLYYQEGSTEPVEYKGLTSSRSDLRMPWMFTRTFVQRDRREEEGKTPVEN